jgi:hypothetical protein
MVRTTVTTRMRRVSAAVALVAALVLGSWSLASAASLSVDGGILQSWELEANLPVAQPDAELSGTREPQDSAEPEPSAASSTLPAPTGAPVPEANAGEPAASPVDSSASEPIGADDAGPAPTAAPSVPEP